MNQYNGAHAILLEFLCCMQNRAAQLLAYQMPCQKLLDKYIYLEWLSIVIGFLEIILN